MATQREDLVERCTDLHEDLDLAPVHAWKRANPRGKAVGYLPTYVPREILHAAGVLPVGILGGGDRLEIVRGDAYFQSYICHLPRSVIELGLSGRLDVLDGMIFPSTCDVIRNLCGIWQLRFPDKLARYLDVPQNFAPEVGGRFYRGVLAELLSDVAALTGRRPEDCDVAASIRLYNENRRLVAELRRIRRAEPWLAPASEAYVLQRAGMVLPVEEHSALLADYLALVRQEDRPMRDDAYVVLNGAFCEQPPLTLIKTLERAGCEVVEDDTLQVLRWLGPDVDPGDDALAALANAYLSYQGAAASRYVPEGTRKGEEIVATVRAAHAEGVIFAAPSFCDPALLDRPMLVAALEAAGISSTSFKYAENTGQMQPIREQAGTFADTIKLWGEA
jgi:benzoyl-CoA reductase subunit C